MKITIGFNEFKNSALTVKEEFIKAGFTVVENNELEFFEITIFDVKKDLLEFYKIFVNN